MRGHELAAAVEPPDYAAVEDYIASCGSIGALVADGAWVPDLSAELLAAAREAGGRGWAPASALVALLPLVGAVPERLDGLLRAALGGAGALHALLGEMRGAAARGPLRGLLAVLRSGAGAGLLASVVAAARAPPPAGSGAGPSAPLQLLCLLQQHVFFLGAACSLVPAFAEGVLTQCAAICGDAAGAAASPAPARALVALQATMVGHALPALVVALMRVADARLVGLLPPCARVLAHVDALVAAAAAGGGGGDGEMHIRTGGGGGRPGGAGDARALTFGVNLTRGLACVLAMVARSVLGGFVVPLEEAAVGACLRSPLFSGGLAAAAPDAGGSGGDGEMHIRTGGGGGERFTLLAAAQSVVSAVRSVHAQPPALPPALLGAFCAAERAAVVALLYVRAIRICISRVPPHSTYAFPSAGTTRACR